MENELINLKNNALSLILEAEDEKELEEIKLQFLGRSGKLTQAIRKLPKIDIEKRKELGVLANEVKETIEASVDEKKKQLKKGILMSKIRKIDVTNLHGCVKNDSFKTNKFVKPSIKLCSENIIINNNAIHKV